MDVMSWAPLTVLIPTYGCPRLLGRTLASLAKCCLLAGYRKTVVTGDGKQSGIVAESAQAHSRPKSL